MNPYQYAVGGAFAVLGGIFVLRGRPDLLFSLALASLGFGNFWIDAFGSLWFPIKVVSLWSMIYLALNGQWSARIPRYIRGIGQILVLFLFLGCAVGYLVPIPETGEGASGFQGTALRPLIQLFGYLSATSLFALALLAFQVPGFLRRTLDHYAFVAIVVAIVGVYQFVAQKTGLGFMPIYRPVGENGIAAFTYGNLVIDRLYSLTGEPKALGIFLTPFVVMGLALGFRPRNQFQRWWNRRSLFALVAIVDILTYSTAVLIALAAAAVVLWALDRRPLFQIASILVVAFSLVAFTTSSLPGSDITPGSGPSLQSLVYARTVERMDAEYKERNETAALRQLEESPIYIVTGFGLGMYVYHLPGLLGDLYGVNPIDSGWITTELDLGILGALCLLIFGLVGAFSAISESSRGAGTSRANLQMLAGGVIASLCLHLGTGAIPMIMIWTGLAVGAVSEARRVRTLASGRHASKTDNRSTAVLFGN